MSVWISNQIFCDQRANTDVGKMLCTRTSFRPLAQFAGWGGKKGVVAARGQPGGAPQSLRAALQTAPSCLLSNCSCPYFPAGRKGKVKVMWPLVFWNNMITMHIFKGHDCWRTAGDGGGNSLPVTFRPGGGTRRTCRAREKQWGKLGVARTASLSPFIISEIDLY